MYYQTNALYEYFESHPDDRFFFVASNMWILAYGDSDCEPRLLVLVSGGREEELEDDITEKEYAALDILSCISKGASIPWLFIRFPVDVEAISNVMAFHPSNGFEKLELDELKEIYARAGLPISKTPTAKYLNDRSSSAYHNWQRHQLGRSLKVTDIDLINIKDGEIFAFYELKRSFIDLDRWQPYRDDYPNFVLLSKIATKVGLSFRIAYNVRTKDPWNDDISRIKVFGFMHEPLTVEDFGVYSLAEFLEI